ncbi:hypothetical protein JW824_02445 [bacterium]|nr:hypothetical protein [bacterium]
MISFKKLSIKRKLMFITTLASMTALVIVCLTFILYERIRFRSALLNELSIMAEIISNNSTAALSFDDSGTAEEILSALSASPSIVCASIYRSDYRLFAVYNRDYVKINVPEKLEQYPYRFEKDYLVFNHSIVLEGEEIGHLRIQYHLKEMYAYLNQFIGIVAWIFLLSNLVVFLLILKFQHVISKPILHLLQIVKNVSLKKDYSIRAEKKTEDELGLLIDGFNEMLIQIQKRDLVLQENQEELERRVDERTEALQQEIIERQKAEDQLRDSLQEKEVLLKEIHHRVKNNLQVISSLLYIQSKKIKDKNALEQFKDSQNRVRSMALVHEKLYRSKNFVNINLEEYLRSITYHLLQTYSTNGKHIDIQIRVDEIPLSIEKAIPCGLIVSELVSNSLKYAFPGDRNGVINIELFSENGDQAHSADMRSCTLVVSDNGVGFPKNFNMNDTSTLGLQLVRNLTQQMDGVIELDCSSGTSFKIRCHVHV